MEGQVNKHNKVWKGIVIFLLVLLGTYLRISVYFINHFYFGTVINHISVSGKTIEGAQKEVLSKTEGYVLELEGRDGTKEQIQGKDIDLKYNLDTKIKELKDTQNGFEWIYKLLMPKDFKISDVVNYDKELLEKQFDNLSYFDTTNIIEPRNPNFEYKDNGYAIVEEVYGNKVKKDILYEHIVKAILDGETKLSLESINCYENPKYTSNSKEVIEAKNILDKYVEATVIYTFGDRTEVLDKSKIHNWINVNNDLEVILDEKEVNSYVDKLANTYNTVGTTRDFGTSLGTTAKVSGGYYGWRIDNSQEVQSLIEIIKEGKSVTREPIYKQKALSRNLNDIGNTYVEINMSNQHLWFYKNGALVVEGDVVTGNVSRGHSTPVGVYELNYKQKDTTLKGADYSANVSFWMPFNGGVGIHDASWRGAFGGQIYLSNGSHGCVNSPYYLASTIFKNIEPGTPIICYY